MNSRLCHPRRFVDEARRFAFFVNALSELLRGMEPVKTQSGFFRFRAWSATQMVPRSCSTIGNGGIPGRRVPTG
jgi:hypothetical protein